MINIKKVKNTILADAENHIHTSNIKHSEQKLYYFSHFCMVTFTPKTFYSSQFFMQFSKV